MEPSLKVLRTLISANNMALKQMKRFCFLVLGFCGQGTPVYLDIHYQISGLNPKL